MSHNSAEYPLSASLWPDGGMIEVFDEQLSECFCTIPIGFLNGSALKQWSFILYCLEACISGQFVLLRENGEEQDTSAGAPVVAGKYGVRSSGE